jgi:glycosyltransferase involved in cell wall biosynthesis
VSSPIERRATICIATFQRPAGLARLLAAISELIVPDVLVVDNDPEGSAQAVVDQAQGLRVRHVLESTRGIPQVRNRAVVESAPSPWIAFIDDDEWPEPNWWQRLVEVQIETDGDIVIGPSEPVFEQEPAAWIREGRFFERERFATGTEVPSFRARTSGVMIRRAAFEYLGERPFDERHPLAGGSDVRLFADMNRHGARIIWVDDAIVNELVPASRSNTRWILRRAFRTGNSRSVTLLLGGAGLGRRVKRVGKGVIEVAVGIGRLVTARNKADRMLAIAHSALGLGLAAGALGVRYDEYVVTHGQ